MIYTADTARIYIATVRWQFDRTMPQWPHEYTVRTWNPDLEVDFFAFSGLVWTEGTIKPWPPEASVPRYHHTYFEVDGWEYWTMEEPVPETTVINRARV